MILELPEQSRSLGAKMIPIFINPFTGQIAPPDGTWLTDGKYANLNWDCNDWMVFHQSVVKHFMAGKTKSKIKYSKDAAIKMTNDVFRQHWSKSAGAWRKLKCGYTSEFFRYFKEVGLTDILSIFQAALATTTNVATTVLDVTEKSAKIGGEIVVGAGDAIKGGVDTVSNVAGLAKYIVPLGLGITGLLVVAYVYKNYIKGDSKVEDLLPGGQIKKLAYG